jgi:hypothetical protein
MPTLQEARDDVLARLGQPSDGADNPALLEMVVAEINAAQRFLAMSMRPSVLQARHDISWAGGQRSADMPVGLKPGKIDAVYWFDGTDYTLLQGGAQLQDLMTDDTGIPTYWGAEHVSRTDEVTTNSYDYTIIINPAPTDAGTVRIDYRREPVTVSLDADLVLPDYESVVLTACISLAPGIAPQRTAILRERLAATLEAAKREEAGTVRDFTMSPRRAIGAQKVIDRRLLVSKGLWQYL